MYCEKHPKYTGYRRPSNECLSCWRVYLNKKDKILTDYIESISSKSPELAQYLIRNEVNIIFAPVVREVEMEAPSGFEFSNVEELVAEGFGEAFEDLPKEDIKEGVSPIVEEINEEIEDIVLDKKPQRGRFV